MVTDEQGKWIHSGVPATMPKTPCPVCGQLAVQSDGIVRKHYRRRRFGYSKIKPVCPTSRTRIDA